MFLLDQNSREYEAREEGRAEGLAEGEDIGKKKGLDEGRHEKAIDTAAKLKTRGMAIGEICDITGLTKEEIETL
jgi:predicted transposase/invertase (TIGR01784 family)